VNNKNRSNKMVISLRKVIKINELELHPLHAEIYGEEPIFRQMLKSIKKHGVLNDLVVNRDNQIISGRRRFLHCCHLGLDVIDEVPCEIREFENELDEEEKLLEYNRYRKKTDIQLANEAKKLSEIYGKQAEIRMKAGIKQDNNTQDQVDPTQIFAEGSNNQPGETREKVAKHLGMSHETLRKLEKVREASESEDPNISTVGRRLLLSDYSKSKKYNLLLAFLRIYKDRNNEDPQVQSCAHGLITDVVEGLVNIEDADIELQNYKTALKNKKKALQDEYPSDDYESEDAEYIEDESEIKDANSILNAKPIEQAYKPKVSPKYEALLKVTSHENKIFAAYAKDLIKKVDGDLLTADDAYNEFIDFRRNEQARVEMLKVPDEPGEEIEKEVEYMEEADPEVVKEHLGGCDKDCASCKLQDQFKFCKDSLEDKTKTLIKLSMKAAKKEGDWTMDNHVLLNEVLQAHSK